MEKNQTQKGLVITQIGKPPVYQDTPILVPKQGQVLIKVHASTINPSDRLRSRGAYFQTDPPFVGGFEGTGQVVQAPSQADKYLIGKRVSFTTLSGSWASYAVADASGVWEIDQSVPLGSAASGIVNPVTVMGMVDTFQKLQIRGQKGKGIIHTAASSALGRMLNKLCIKKNVPLLNIVRRKQQAQILKSQGATHIINTSDQDWFEQYLAALKNFGFNVLFDALGGGDILQKIVVNLNRNSQVFLYGKLQSKPFTLHQPLILTKGIFITGFILWEYLPTISQEQLKKLREQLSQNLKNELATHTIKQVKFSQVPNEWDLSQQNATQGKYLLLP